MMMRPDPADRPTADILLATIPRIREILMRRLESNWVRCAFDPLVLVRLLIAPFV